MSVTPSIDKLFLTLLVLSLGSFVTPNATVFETRSLYSIEAYARLPSTRFSESVWPLASADCPTLEIQIVQDTTLSTLLAGHWVGRWINPYIDRGGIDTSVFSEHSSMRAGASNAVVNGVPIDAVLRTAKWTKESFATFAKFYHKSYSGGPVANFILGM